MQGREARLSEQLGSWRCDKTSRVKNRFGLENFLGGDASCEETLRVAFLVRGVSMENRFIKGAVSYVLQFLKRCEPPLMLIYGEFGTVA